MFCTQRRIKRKGCVYNPHKNKKNKKIRVVKYKNGVFQNQSGDEYFA